MELATQLIKVGGSLLLVLALFFALIYGLKRWGKLVRKPANQPVLEVLSKHSFGPRHHLMLVRIPGGQNVLVGVSPQNMSLLPAAPTTAEAVPPAEGTGKV
ncbi:MAG: flagellar biosynthetic protein FliO [Syntrophobacteraceae bacterium]